ncbi:hypothetical protein PR001_g1142 [Phytophthora rubi]|uniref:Uncharacterized protein n=1 Tax=Phytophthora rubi TaxID=129364 RepID=A0A6A3P1C8_9STRA|nr:hypothetical protein PR001_g1142 [Phytophthora rubi]
MDEMKQYFERYRPTRDNTTNHAYSYDALERSWCTFTRRWNTTRREGGSFTSASGEGELQQAELRAVLETAVEVVIEAADVRAATTRKVREVVTILGAIAVGLMEVNVVSRARVAESAVARGSRAAPVGRSSSPMRAWPRTLLTTSGISATT